MVEVSTYEVRAERSGRFWHLEVPVIGQVTQARNTREIEEMVRDLIEVMTGDTDVQLEVGFVLPGRTQEHLDRAARLRETEANARREAAAEVRIAAKELKAEGLPLRDVGAVLGISHQRAAQLIND